MEDNSYVSLYDYLGKAAGPELGKEVYHAAKKIRIPVESRYVANNVYTGNVMLYPQAFLQMYFNQNTNNG